MRRIFTFVVILMALTACSANQAKVVPDNPATDMPQAGMPNPASVYCTQNGNKLEIHTAADGSQSGVCIFPDGSTCDEWDYFRGECGLVEQKSPAPDATVEAIENASGGFMEPGTAEEIADWRGVIKSTEHGAQYDDYFEWQDNGQVIYFGIDSMDPAIKAQIEALRDSGKVVHLSGTLLSNVPDYNGSQIQVDRIDIEETEVVNTPTLSPDTTSITETAYPLLKTTMGDFIIVSARLVDEARDTKAPPGDKFLLVELARPGMEKLVMGEFPLESFREMVTDSRNDIYVLRDDGSQVFYSGMGGWLNEDEFVMGFTVFQPLPQTYTLYWTGNPPIELNIEK